jgi:hypothetical protein
VSVPSNQHYVNKLSELQSTHTSAVHMLTALALLFAKKSCPTIRHVGVWGERRYTYNSFSTSALDGGEWSASLPGRALAPGEEPPVPIVQEAE